jgi:cobalt-zinc-cadmium efflux system membrane fusion protein
MNASVSSDSLELNEKQATNFKIKPVEMANFSAQFAAYGSIDFNENTAVQVFTPYQGKILQSFADVGDFVSKGQPLYTVDSSDLAQAESTLLSAKGVYDQTSATLSRAKELYQMRSISLKELEQNTSDQNAADASLKAAREGVRIFGKTSAEIQRIENEKKMDAVLVVPSPITGQVVTRNAQPGLLVQPGNTPAPYVVADVSNKWLIINASEEDSTKLHVGQDLDVTVPVLPEESFKGKIKVIGSIVDPNTRTVLVRADVSDPKRVLRSGMYATYLVKGDKLVKGLGVPEEALVREGDGTMSVWVTENERHWDKRSVTLGLRTNGLVQVISGLKEGEKIATTGAIFLSNMLVIDK